MSRLLEIFLEKKEHTDLHPDKTYYTTIRAFTIQTLTMEPYETLFVEKFCKWKNNKTGNLSENRQVQTILYNTNNYFKSDMLRRVVKIADDYYLRLHELEAD